MLANMFRNATLGREVRLLQSLAHPNIIAYLDSFIENNELIIVFEWAEAGDLKRQVRKALEKKARFDERVVWKPVEHENFRSSVPGENDDAVDDDRNAAASRGQRARTTAARA